MKYEVKNSNQQSSQDNVFKGQISTFEKYLNIFWPVERHELPKFFLITSLMFCILFNQNIIRALKDGIVITNIGTETITFLKFWGVMPASFIMAAIYVALVNRMSGQKVFYLILGSFLIFFGIFAFFILPHHDTFHLNAEKTSELVAAYPHFKWFILLSANWSFSLFYIIAELWPTTIFSLLFWQFVNNITNVDESKRFYTLFGLFGQTGLYFSGTFLGMLPNLSLTVKDFFGLGLTKSIVSVQIALSLVIFLGSMSLIIFYTLNSQTSDNSLKFKGKTNKLSVAESLNLVFSSRYIRLIAILLFCYGAAINLVEGPWKSVAEQVYPNTEDYLAFVGSYLKYTGILIILLVFIGSNVVRYVGWFSAAIATPIMVLITGLVFFISSNFDLTATVVASYFLLSDPLMPALTIGAIQNILSKSTKYTLFDATKEMAYVPLEPEIKTKGKAAADLIGTKFGKSSSAFLQSIIFAIFPSMTYASLSSSLMIVFILICAVWIWCVRELDIEYSKKI